MATGDHRDKDKKHEHHDHPSKKPESSSARLNHEGNQEPEKKPKKPVAVQERPTQLHSHDGTSIELKYDAKSHQPSAFQITDKAHRVIAAAQASDNCRIEVNPKSGEVTLHTKLKDGGSETTHYSVDGLYHTERRDKENRKQSEVFGHLSDKGPQPHRTVSFVRWDQSKPIVAIEQNATGQITQKSTFASEQRLQSGHATSSERIEYSLNKEHHTSTETHLVFDGGGRQLQECRKVVNDDTGITSFDVRSNNAHHRLKVDGLGNVTEFTREEGGRHTIYALSGGKLTGLDGGKHLNPKEAEVVLKEGAILMASYKQQFRLDANASSEFAKHIGPTDARDCSKGNGVVVWKVGNDQYQHARVEQGQVKDDKGQLIGHMEGAGLLVLRNGTTIDTKSTEGSAFHGIGNDHQRLDIVGGAGTKEYSGTLSNAKTGDAVRIIGGNMFDSQGNYVGHLDRRGNVLEADGHITAINSKFADWRFEGFEDGQRRFFVASKFASNGTMFIPEQNDRRVKFEVREGMVINTETHEQLGMLRPPVEGPDGKLAGGSMLLADGTEKALSYYAKSVMDLQIQGESGVHSARIQAICLASVVQADGTTRGDAFFNISQARREQQRRISIADDMETAQDGRWVGAKAWDFLTRDGEQKDQDIVRRQSESKHAQEALSNVLSTGQINEEMLQALSSDQALAHRENMGTELAAMKEKLENPPHVLEDLPQDTKKLNGSVDVPHGEKTRLHLVVKDGQILGADGKNPIGSLYSDGSLTIQPPGSSAPMHIQMKDLQGASWHLNYSDDAGNQQNIEWISSNSRLISIGELRKNAHAETEYAREYRKINPPNEEDEHPVDVVGQAEANEAKFNQNLDRLVQTGPVTNNDFDILERGARTHARADFLKEKEVDRPVIKAADMSSQKTVDATDGRIRIGDTAYEIHKGELFKITGEVVEKQSCGRMLTNYRVELADHGVLNLASENRTFMELTTDGGKTMQRLISLGDSRMTDGFGYQSGGLVPVNELLRQADELRQQAASGNADYFEKRPWITGWAANQGMGDIESNMQNMERNIGADADRVRQQTQMLFSEGFKSDFRNNKVDSVIAITQTTLSNMGTSTQDLNQVAEQASQAQKQANDAFIIAATTVATAGIGVAFTSLRTAAELTTMARVGLVAAEITSCAGAGTVISFVGRHRGGDEWLGDADLQHAKQGAIEGTTMGVCQVGAAAIGQLKNIRQLAMLKNAGTSLSAAETATLESTMGRYMSQTLSGRGQLMFRLADGTYRLGNAAVNTVGFNVASQVGEGKQVHVDLNETAQGTLFMLCAEYAGSKVSGELKEKQIVDNMVKERAEIACGIKPIELTAGQKLADSLVTGVRRDTVNAFVNGSLGGMEQAKEQERIEIAKRFGIRSEDVSDRMLWQEMDYRRFVNKMLESGAMAGASAPMMAAGSAAIHTAHENHVTRIAEQQLHLQEHLQINTNFETHLRSQANQLAADNEHELAFGYNAAADLLSAQADHSTESLNRVAEQLRGQAERLEEKQKYELAAGYHAAANDLSPDPRAKHQLAEPLAAPSDFSLREPSQVELFRQLIRQNDAKQDFGIRDEDGVIRTVQRDMRVYNVDGLPTQILIPVEYAEVLDRYREAAQQHPLKAAFAKNVLPVLPDLLSTTLCRSLGVVDYPEGAPPLMPEHIAKYLRELADPSLVHTVVLSDHNSEFDTPTFTSAADSQNGRIRFFKAPANEEFYRATMQHEWTHLLGERTGSIEAAFEVAAQIEHERGNAYYKDLYSQTRPAHKPWAENWAVHLGEDFLSPKVDDFHRFVKQAPLRAVVLADALQQALDSVPGDRRSYLHDQMAERIKYVEQRIQPLFVAELQKSAGNIHDPRYMDSCRLLGEYGGVQPIHQIQEAMKNNTDVDAQRHLWKGFLEMTGAKHLEIFMDALNKAIAQNDLGTLRDCLTAAATTSHASLRMDVLKAIAGTSNAQLAREANNLLLRHMPVPTIAPIVPPLPPLPHAISAEQNRQLDTLFEAVARLEHKDNAGPRGHLEYSAGGDAVDKFAMKSAPELRAQARGAIAREENLSSCVDRMAAVIDTWKPLAGDLFANSQRALFQLNRANQEANEILRRSGVEYDPQRFHESEYMRGIIADRPMAAAAYDRYLVARADYAAAVATRNAPLIERKNALVEQLNAAAASMTDEHGKPLRVPPATVSLSDNLGSASARYQPGQGRILLQSMGLADTRAHADLIGSALHEFQHLEQDTLVVRSILDRHNAGVVLPHDVRESIHAEYQSRIGTPLSDEFLSSVIKARGGQKLLAEETARAESLMNAFASNSSSNRTIFDNQERVVQAELKKLDDVGQLTGETDSPARNAMLKRLEEIRQNRDAAYDAYRQQAHEQESWAVGELARRRAMDSLTSPQQPSELYFLEYSSLGQQILEANGFGSKSMDQSFNLESRILRKLIGAELVPADNKDDAWLHLSERVNNASLTDAEQREVAAYLETLYAGGADSDAILQQLERIQAKPNLPTPQERWSKFYERLEASSTESKYEREKTLRFLESQLTAVESPWSDSAAVSRQQRLGAAREQLAFIQSLIDVAGHDNLTDVAKSAKSAMNQIRKAIINELKPVGDDKNGIAIAATSKAPVFVTQATTLPKATDSFDVDHIAQQLKNGDLHPVAELIRAKREPLIQNVLAKMVAARIPEADAASFLATAPIETLTSWSGQDVGAHIFEEAIALEKLTHADQHRRSSEQEFVRKMLDEASKITGPEQDIYLRLATAVQLELATVRDAAPNPNDRTDCCAAATSAHILNQVLSATERAIFIDQILSGRNVPIPDRGLALRANLISLDSDGTPLLNAEQIMALAGNATGSRPLDTIGKTRGYVTKALALFSKDRLSLADESGRSWFYGDNPKPGLYAIVQPEHIFFARVDKSGQRTTFDPLTNRPDWPLSVSAIIDRKYKDHQEAAKLARHNKGKEGEEATLGPHASVYAIWRVSGTENL